MAEPFPLASERDFLMLYPSGEDGLELRWRLRSLPLRAAREAFPSSSPTPSVRLHSFAQENDHGAPCGVHAPLASLQQGRLGFRDLRQNLWYQAEVGLGHDEGGWLMLARSNRLALPCLTALERAPSNAPKTITKTDEPEPVRPAIIARAASDSTLAHQSFSGGSGPLVSACTEIALWGALRITGQAPPGTALELGGHAYQVGPGGHFAFDLQLIDADLIHALLRLLPELPVEARDAE